MLGSLADVRHSLRGKGSDLVVRVGPLQEAFQEIVRQSSVGEIIAEEEVEHRCASPAVTPPMPCIHTSHRVNFFHMCVMLTSFASHMQVAGGHIRCEGKFTSRLAVALLEGQPL